MKLILAILLLAASAFAAPLTVDGNMNVITNGSNFGRAEDFIAANPARTGEVMLAIRAFHQTVIADAAAKSAQADAVIATAQQTATDAAAQAAALVTALVKVDPKTLPDEVKVAMQTPADKQRAELAKQKADIEAKLAALP